MKLVSGYKLLQGYERNIFLIVQKVCDSYRTVADPRAQQHEEAYPGLHFTALQSTRESKRNVNTGFPDDHEMADKVLMQTRYVIFYTY